MSHSAIEPPPSQPQSALQWPPSPLSEPIRAFWNGQDDHAIVYDKHGNESTQLGVETYPLVLMPEQTTVLLQHGIIHLVNDRAVFLQRFNRAAAGSEPSSSSSSSNTAMVVDAPQQPQASDGPSASTTAVDVNAVAEDTAAGDAGRIEVAAPISLFSAEPPLADAEWKFPITFKQRLRTRVFSELWQRGHYMTAASKFGGDFLVYPGDPFRYHSQFVAIVMPAGQSFSAVDLAAIGRLGTTVRKTVLLCGVTEQGAVELVSVNWSGMV
ncbi:hypothetical protein CAOG_002022 [Capsaspora owczarzaki ATCC 30864]|uniref:tRNA-splicing endonuclease subunit SEN34 n=1 Tax=Capsaspora owczarzaki (strain ATCC 30864) TaxID=595528 RepID=A0A0D2WLK2_CAPO3|nr:hypothetical protein CAOG_002022 [Capsaspora owczarzaki ATCC 30864]